MARAGIRSKIEKKTNICADCVYPIGDCPWLNKNEPVKGWGAKKVKWRGSKPDTYTYSITKCPLFISPDERPKSCRYDDINLEQIQIMNGRWARKGE